MSIDQRTGRPFGDHGTSSEAIEYALDAFWPGGIEFLSAWRDGGLDEWPEFYEWLRARADSPTPHTPPPSPTTDATGDEP